MVGLGGLHVVGTERHVRPSFILAICYSATRKDSASRVGDAFGKVLSQRAFLWPFAAAYSCRVRMCKRCGCTCRSRGALTTSCEGARGARATPAAHATSSAWRTSALFFPDTSRVYFYQCSHMCSEVRCSTQQCVLRMPNGEGFFWSTFDYPSSLFAVMWRAASTACASCNPAPLAFQVTPSPV